MEKDNVSHNELEEARGHDERVADFFWRLILVLRMSSAFIISEVLDSEPEEPIVAEG